MTSLSSYLLEQASELQTGRGSNVLRLRLRAKPAKLALWCCQNPGVTDCANTLPALCSSDLGFVPLSGNAKRAHSAHHDLLSVLAFHQKTLYAQDVRVMPP